MAKLNKVLWEMLGINDPDSKAALSPSVEAVETEAEIVTVRNCMTTAKSTCFDTPAVSFRIGVAKGHFMVPDNIDTDDETIEKLFTV